MGRPRAGASAAAVCAAPPARLVLLLTSSALLLAARRVSAQFVSVVLGGRTYRIASYQATQTYLSNYQALRRWVL